jgi:hypothetical protein
VDGLTSATTDSSVLVSGTAVRKAIEHAGACWLPYGCRDSTDCCVGGMLYIHGLMINEVFMLNKGHIGLVPFRDAAAT